MRVRSMIGLAAALLLAACSGEGPGSHTPERTIAPGNIEILSRVSTTLTLNDTGGYVAGPASLVATVRRFDNHSPIRGLPVSFWIGSRFMGTVNTDAVGQAFLTFNLHQNFYSTKYSSRAQFSGTTAYSSSSDLGNFQVYKANPRFSSTGVPFVRTGTSQRITLRMVDPNSEAIAGRYLYVAVNGGSESSIKTASDGSFSFTVSVKKGQNNARVRFTGDSYFNSTTQTLWVVQGT